jgi:hypothetical protein
METQHSTYRLTERDQERLTLLKLRYRLETDVDAVRVALYLAAQQAVILSERKLAEIIGHDRFI